ncbi:restriction endonuclease [Metabacillus idriensis]|uniref:restriction endonuclease n=1 Tax=Metabacillus idriensis TaxID=324768 RepID=UPI00203D3F67|nr:restriction endonuclease [Metabacillus idriensis]MCM3596203.1 restriction endonuclease [Metabacillus idriensis]
MATKSPYEKTIFNTRLGISKKLTAKTWTELEKKINDQKARWDSQVQKIKNKSIEERELMRAEGLLREVQQTLYEYKNMLLHSAEKTHSINWNHLMKKEEMPPFTYKESPPQLDDYFIKHNVPSPSFWEEILPFMKKSRLKFEEAAKTEFESDYQFHKSEKDKSYQEYLREKRLFEASKKSHNQYIQGIKDGLKNEDPKAICDYFSIVLMNSPAPIGFERNFEINYVKDTKIMVVDYILPKQSEIPKAIDVKYVKTRKEIVEKHMNQKELDLFYDSVIYQLTLKTLHEIFSSDANQCLNSIVFNGWIHGTSLSTGQEYTSCILTLHVSKEEYQRLNLERVDPKECFRKLNGLSIGALKNVAPVKPYMQFTMNEKRFVESRDILVEVENIPNIAKMPWEDFEHLVRGLFERMFSNNGSEVRTTKASRDGGVDVVVYDPDPIRGGTFVIQAKRYNKVVPVSAVRDLYGTMINEGAVKGFLVTTSYYGNDSHKFVKDKPITLIDGSYLVHLFQEHGYAVKIATE